MNVSEYDIAVFDRTIALANEAEKQGNLPVGAVITLEGEIVAEGQNAIWFPKFNPNRHAEIEALRSVPEHLWGYARDMVLYTTLEPCLMCLGAVLLHRIGRVIYGASDTWGGACQVARHMPRAFEERMSQSEWLGPAYPSKCDPLFERVMVLVEERRNSGEFE